jgi:hypothetical protein
MYIYIYIYIYITLAGACKIGVCGSPVPRFVGSFGRHSPQMQGFCGPWLFPNSPVGDLVRLSMVGDSICEKHSVENAQCCCVFADLRCGCKDFWRMVHVDTLLDSGFASDSGSNLQVKLVAQKVLGAGPLHCSFIAGHTGLVAIFI